MAAQTEHGKKLDRRVVRTRKAIMDAFDLLLAKTDIEKITVSAIAREANIDRKTFYLHFGSVDDLANYRAEACLQRITTVLEERGCDASFEERLHIALQEVNVVISEDIDIYARIASSLSIDQLFCYFEQAAKSTVEHSGYESQYFEDPVKRKKLQFYIAGALSLYSTWLKTDHSEPIENISAIIEDSVC